MLKRLKDDFHLAMLTLVGLIIVICLTPYAIYRLMSGNVIVGLADLLMVITAAVAVGYAWRTGDTLKPGQAMAIIFCAGAALICITLGIDGLFWVYPFLVFIFFLVSPLKAFILLLLLLVTLISYATWRPGVVFSGAFQMLSFVVTTTITSFFAYIFAYRTQLQRKALNDLATTDSLTGASNRRTLNEQLAAAIVDFSRSGTSCGLMVLDLDYFKKVNDEFGHKVGDQVLTALVPIVQSMIRQRDQVFRFGGEEFVILLRDIKQADLVKLAEKIRAGVQQKLMLPDGSYLTTSIGAAILQPSEDWEAWLHRADMALYQAKHQGRNKVVSAT